MKNLYLLFTLFLFLSLTSLQAQEPIPRQDSICVNESDLATLSFDLTLNDLDPSGQITLQDPTMCFRMVGNNLTYTGFGNCPCGETYILFYFYENNPAIAADIIITIKCDNPKPECFLNNLEDLPDPSTGQVSCLYACEFSTATYFVPHILGNTYSWIINGHISYSTNPNGNQIDINWGPEGPGNITLIITNGGTTTFIDICVDILEGPVADFTKTADCICLDGSISFTNTSVGANSFLWDFGDSNTSINPNPTHTYTTPGTYKVILWAFKNNQNSKGDPLCCCADSMSMYVTVEPGEGPGIYWVSTLCPGDKSYYWTDATNCGMYNWDVFDENGNPHPFTTTANGDSICVTWGGGPQGTISLSVTGCDDPYCSKPTVVLVPIISAVSLIVGDVDVCENSTVTYTLPKWPNVYYDWTVVGGTVLPGDNGSNTVTILWGSGPTGTIHVDYWSTFLGGLPGHNQADCAGVADLTVSILPPFSITGPTPSLVCINSTSFFSATNAPWPNYNWTVSPGAPITGNGSSNISIDWISGPGTYTVTAMPTVPGHYCNDSKSFTVLVMETPIPDSISGPKKICPGETYTYFGHSSLPNTIMNWTVTGGTATSYTGSPITVTWNTTGPFSLGISQTMASPPGCTSDELICPVMEKEINDPVIFTAGPACINSEQMYNAGTLQNADAELEWKISPLTAGSVVGGQGTIAPTVQWNNDAVMATLTYCVTLCGVTKSHAETFMLNAPMVATITQIGGLCPGGTAVLDASSGFTSYLWSGPVVSSSEDITITAGGTYVLTTVDGNGCSATTSIDVVALPSPVASISTPDPRNLCLPAVGQGVRLYAQTNPNYEFEWFCNGTSVQGPSPAAIFTHIGTNADSNFAYCVWVTDLSTTCRKKSNVLVVSQDTCGGGPGNCIPQNYTFNIGVSNPAPSCDVADFTVNNTGNVTLGGWNFGDPVNNTNTGSIINAQHTYSKAGYYTATLSGSVPNTVMPQPPAPPNCPVSASVSVCIPLAADFRYVEDCQEVCFTDLSTFLPGQNITIWDWNFGDGNFSALQDPCHVYSSPGTYTVKLTVENANNCMVMKQIMVTVLGPPSASVIIAPNPACVGDPISFMSTGSGIVDWLWNFGDTATNGAQNPSHTYLKLGSYDVTLIVKDINGCMDTSTTNVIIFPNPADDTITYSPSLVECEGTTITLTAPSGPYTYAWSSGPSSASINVTTAGDYHVTVTDGQGCKMVTDPVTVVFIPPPPVQITGPHFICDAGCVTLNATAGPGYIYQWLDASMAPIPGAINPTYDVCDTIPMPTQLYVHVIDANGCQSFAGPHFVDLVPSPSFTISTVGDLCAGSMNILSVPILPDVLYQWSTGEVGSSIIAIPAGTYTVIGLDTFTGCSHSESVVINPLPDLCIMPTGCYKVCNPDTLCGPDSMTAYQWNMNGTAIFGATSQCYIVTVSGSYSLTATNEFNCSATSDTLILEVMECTDCVDQEITANSLAGDGCCYALSYFNTIPDAYGLMMHTGNADITPDLGSLDPSLSVFTIGSNYIGLVANGGGNLPVGGLTGYLDFCLTNITNVPQVVIFDWYNDSLEIVCSDTLIFDCPVETDCIYITHDTIYCGPNNQVLYEFTVCNSGLNTFTFNYLTLVPSTPPGLVVSPNFFNLSPGLVPGSCTTLTVTLSGSNIANEEFCFNAIGHLSDPAVDPDALCCSLDSLQCIDIPGCSPCDKVYLEAEQISDDPCCYAVQLNNNLDANTFTGIRICALTPGTGLSIDNPFGSDWLTASFSPTVIDLIYNGSTSSLPLGSTSLPKICIDETTTPTQLIEIKWMSGSDIVCRDTFVAECEPPCGYIYNDSVYCTENNQWIFEGYIRNTSAHTMSTAVISFVDASLTGYNQTINLGSLPPGGTYGPFFINIGTPATPGQIVCVDVILHEVGHNNQHENCCVFRHCFEIPDCGGPKPCLCDQDFEEQVAAGFTCNPGADFQYFFSPLGQLMLCDKAVWTWDDGTPSTSVVGPTSILHQFPGPGSYEVCMTVYRSDDNGKKCKARFCKEVEIHQNRVNLSPNPAHGSVNLEWNVTETGQANLRLYSPEQILVRDWQQQIIDTKYEHSLNLNDVAPGLYFIIMELNGEQWIEKLMVY